MVSALLFQDVFESLDLNEPDNLSPHKGFILTCRVLIQTWTEGERSCRFSHAFQTEF